MPRKNSGSSSPTTERFAAELETALHIQEQEKIIAECEVHCQGVLDLVDSDLLGVETEHFVDASLSTKSTIGLMVKDGVVTNMLTGAPAYMSKKIHKGDRVVMVDEKPIDALGAGLTKLLIGCDIPGSIVSLKVQRGASNVEVQLKRACTTDLADKKKMFQLFTQTKDLALQITIKYKDCPDAKLVAPVVDETIELWTKMLEADQVHDEKIVGNVEFMQTQADLLVRQLREELTKLHSISRSAITNMSSIAKEESEMFRELSAAKARADQFEREAIDYKAKWEALKIEHGKCDAIIMSLKQEMTINLQQFNSLQVQYNSLQVQYTKVQLEVKTLNVSHISLQQEHAACAVTINQLRNQVADLEAHHAPCAQIISDLRRQIQETTDSLNDDEAALDLRVMMQQQEVERTRVKLSSSAPSGRVRLGASAGGRLPVPPGAGGQDDIKVKENGAVTVGGIAALKKEIMMLKAKHAPCDELISSLRMQITQITTQLTTIQQAHSGCDDMKQRYNMLVREHEACPNEMRIVTSELTTVQREYKSLIRDHLGCADMISSQQLRLNSMSQELTHKSNLCGVGLRISQFNPQELAKNKSQANLLGAHGVAQAHDHKGNVWVSKVIPGGSAAINGIIKEDDQLLKIDGKAFDSVMTAAGQLRGEPDTTVTLLLQTPNGKSYTVTLVRQVSRTSQQALKYLEQDTRVQQASPYKNLPVLSSNLYSSSPNKYANNQNNPIMGQFVYTSNTSQDSYGRQGQDKYGSHHMYGSQQYGSREAARYEHLSMGQSVSQVTDRDLYGSGMLYASGASVEVAKGYGNSHSPSVGYEMASPRIPRTMKTGRHVCACGECGSAFQGRTGLMM